MGLEQLRVLTTAEGHILKPWLGITELFFAGEVPDELKLGVVSPLPKDEEKFRPVVLLKPMYKVCMATMSSRILRLLHEYGLLDAAQLGFVTDGSCHDPLKIMARLYERGRGADGEELHVAFLDATSAFDSAPHAVLDAALRRLGAPPDFVSWIWAVLSGHRRKAVTAYETDAHDEAIELEGAPPSHPLPGARRHHWSGRCLPTTPWRWQGPSPTTTRSTCVLAGTCCGAWPSRTTSRWCRG